MRTRERPIVGADVTLFKRRLRQREAGQSKPERCVGVAAEARSRAWPRTTLVWFSLLELLLFGRSVIANAVVGEAFWVAQW